MADAPPRPCTKHGCSKTTTEGSRCAEHRFASAAERDARRASSAERGYKGPWPAIRKAFLDRHPMCAGVPEGSCDQAAQDVDHKVPLRDGGTHHWSNLQALCHRCHSRKTAREDGRFGAVRRVFRGPAPPRRAAREGDLWVDDSTKPPTVYVYTKAGRIAPGWTRCDPMKGRRS